ncbi:MAG: GNAT family N-acetyltransferase [Candidatus Omnitrophica bacterium]|nr:GNAT family N-acetyltransferase [Candidatus Omnitrophota bacterium]
MEQDKIFSEKKAVSVFIDSDTIYLRTLTQEGDFSEYESWLNDQENTTYMGSGRFPVTEMALKKYVDDFSKNQNGILTGIFHKSCDKHIGNITLQQIDWRNRNGEIGIIVGDKEQWGKGYATKAIRLIAAHAFNRLNLHKLCAGVIAGNEGSRKAFEKAGFQLEGTLRQSFYLNDEYLDCYRMGLLKNEFTEEKN